MEKWRGFWSEQVEKPDAWPRECLLLDSLPESVEPLMHPDHYYYLDLAFAPAVK
jgi:hypothetical protein